MCCQFTLTFCYPLLIQLLNHCNERPKVTVMFFACDNDVGVVLFKYQVKLEGLISFALALNTLPKTLVVEIYC